MIWGGKPRVADSDDSDPWGEEHEVFVWRLMTLTMAGYPENLAWTLAMAPDIDLHRAVELVEKGCDPLVAARILL